MGENNDRDEQNAVFDLVRSLEDIVLDCLEEEMASVNDIAVRTFRDVCEIVARYFDLPHATTCENFSVLDVTPFYQVWFLVGIIRTI